MRWPIIHIVKRFGRVGGMESYVWHLVHGLLERGLQVVVVCEQVCEPPAGGLRVIKVERSPAKPRWRSMMAFRERVDQRIRQVFSGQSVLIHSHERSLCHHVTTFHGPPIDVPRKFRWFQAISRRLAAWRRMERDELLRDNVQLILPVSNRISVELRQRYPKINSKTLELAWPGVARVMTLPERQRSNRITDTKFLFVGKEWKRKGLDIAVRVVAEFRKQRPNATLTIYGMNRTDVPGNINLYPWIIFRGWSRNIPWSDYDVLLHPARNEPFGMVVSEARSNGIPVIMSSAVGAADLMVSDARVVELQAGTLEWCEQIVLLVSQSDGQPEVKWSWDDLVDKHVEILYPMVRVSVL